MNVLLKILKAKTRNEIRGGKLWEITRLWGMDISTVEKEVAKPAPFVRPEGGTATFTVEITADVRPDTLFAPFHWGGASCANLLTNPALDPLCRMPEFKVCAVRARAGAAAPERATS